jgi:hypothetical protein
MCSPCRSLMAMFCPRCLDEYEPHVRTCATCGLALVATDVSAPVLPEARLGTFHPSVASVLTSLLDKRRIIYRSVPEDDGVAVLVDPAWRDDLRAELVLTWHELVRGLPADEVTELLTLGGDTPGWFDAPRGGWVDRAGRLVVDVDDGEDDARDAGRLVGPAMAMFGAILLLLGWYVGAGAIVVLVGLALLVVGLLLPR